MEQIREQLKSLKTTQVMEIVLDLAQKLDDYSAIIFEAGLEEVELRVSESEYLVFLEKVENRM